MQISMGSKSFPAERVIKGLRAAAQRAREWTDRAHEYTCGSWTRTPRGLL